MHRRIGSSRAKSFSGWGDPVTATAPDVVTPEDSSGFSVRVGDFEGPFDLLLQLISRHKLEVTELALHEVTDEFISYIRAQGSAWDLDEASEFLVVAATLLDLKAARLLPSGEVEDEEDLALLKKTQSPILEEFAPEDHMRFSAADDVTRGGCIIQTHFGVIDARRETKVNQLHQALTS